MPVYGEIARRNSQFKGLKVFHIVFIIEKHV